MNVRTNDGSVPIKMWTEGVDLEEEALAQLDRAATLPFIYKHIAVMPDVHWGKGCTVGAVIPTVNAIIPACVGVDLGCGMIAQRTTLTASELPDSLRTIRDGIERSIPVGGPGVRGSWDEPGRYGPPQSTSTAWHAMEEDYKYITNRHPKIGKGMTVQQLGTLGTGNHFIELCLDETNHVWVMLHSGSRGVGNRVGTYFIEKAKREMARYFIRLPDADLAYLVPNSDYYGDYIFAVKFAQEFARINRVLMMERALDVLRKELPPFQFLETAVNCHHNYIAMEEHFGERVWVTRKGAVSAQEGQLGIIPGSMGAKSFIVRGKGNRESFHSCSHGAGRRMSRTQARKQFTVEDHAAATAGVECRKDAGVLDETPGAYKSIEAVMAAQADLVDVVHTLRQVLCVKG